MYVSLLHRFKGTHMSRFVEVLNEIREQVNIQTFHGILEKIRAKLHAESAHIEIEFPYFIEKTAPRSRAKSLMGTGATSSGRATATAWTSSWGWRSP
jgi:GTP cyclohydrolase I